ncbi:hypothetical protein Poli38472_000122 [Pythium oligandrum]|uniref:Uncharacterized protein n=1 Tax=Pythium oligandrum TaxID=41045 RepID=A0A8K1CC39_PYTOL|nr:hypothetical protein Poli38472_000122 [Pythium oligandrum]|eukprot:TMW60080.1 hypothetical protein Poli38472_000122 [Pythium oligandrum]
MATPPTAPSSTPSEATFGIAFDIDGVLVRGGHVIPRAREVLKSLQEKNIPHVFLTNNGGVLEAAKAGSLGKTLGVEIEPERMILSHTPMRGLAEKFRDSRILLLGSSDVNNVAREYGFKKITTVEDLARHSPGQFAFKTYEQKNAPYHDEPIEAIIIMHDPIDWAPELQITVDVLIGGNPLGSGRPDGTQTPLFISNEDFVFSSEYPFPRFAQGAFMSCLRLLYNKYTGKDLEVTHYGKPHAVTYAYAEALLNKIAGRTASNPLKSIYGIGDNPHADIQGANNAGDHWSSILVRTGIYDGTKDPEHIPDVYADTVFEAIQYIYKNEGLPPL